MCGGHIGCARTSAKQRAGPFLGFFCFFFAMHYFCQFIGKNFLCPVQLASFPVGHLLNLFQRQEGEHPNALDHIRILHIPPILVEVEG